MASSIPLHCNICPKLPKFSDLSHLLTHVASKGHLSHYFKAQVRSASEPSVRRELELYDAWYDRHRIGKLMCQRMKSKDAKPVKTERRRRAKPNGAKGEPDDRAPPRIPIKTQAKVKRELVIDPQLVSIPPPNSFRDEDDELDIQGQITRPGVPYMSSRDNDKSPRADSSQPQVRPVQVALPYPFLMNVKKDEDSKAVAIDERKLFYPDPTIVQPLGFGREVAADFDIGSTGSSLTSIPSDTPDLDDQQIVAECSKLKGTIWPGMDLFDSANALARRRRNQKKDGTILAQMKWTSATVRPRETVYTRDGNVHRIQPITGQIESSPFKQLTPKPKRARAKSQRITLAPIDSNIIRSKKRVQEGAPPRRRGRPRIVQLPETPSKPPKEVARKNPTRKRYPTPANDDEVEWQLTTGEQPIGQRKKMKIYQDADPIDLTTETAPSEALDSFDSNEVFTLFEESSSYTHSPHSATHDLTYLNASFVPHPSSLGNSAWGPYSLGCSTTDPLHPANKENVEPILDPLGRIDDSAAGNQTHYNAQHFYFGQPAQPTPFFNTYSSNLPFGSHYPSGFPMSSYIPPIQYSSAIQYPYAPTMPMVNQSQPTYTPFPPPVLPAQHSPPPQIRPLPFYRLRTPSPHGTIVVDSSMPSVRRKGVSTKVGRLMTRPGGPGSEDGDAGDEPIEVGNYASTYSHNGSFPIRG